MQRLSDRVFIQQDESVMQAHLEGRITIGTYAIREDDTCTFLAADFDKQSWKTDILAYKKAAENIGVEVTMFVVNLALVITMFRKRLTTY